MYFIRILIVAILVALSAGCSLPAQVDETASWSAAKFYQEAKSAQDDGNYQTALRYYSKLEARYPYGRYAQQAQLETIYAHYKGDEPDAAIAAANRFIKLHPRNPNVDYAYYMRGLASFDQGKNFLERVFPQDKSKRDPTTAREAFRYFKQLADRFPHSRYRKDAIQRMVFLRNALARHELYVADYYMRRGEYLAAANRAKYVLENYDRTPSVPKALHMMVNAYHKMGLSKLAADAQRVLQKSYPAEAAKLEKEAPSNTDE